MAIPLSVGRASATELWARLPAKGDPMLSNKQKKNDPASVAKPEHRRILDDTIALFAAHGFSTGWWFDHFCWTENTMSDGVQQHAVTLRSWATTPDGQ